MSKNKNNKKILYLEGLIKNLNEHIKVLKDELEKKGKVLDCSKNLVQELTNDINDLTDENQALKDVVSYMAIEKYKC